ncbi:hypothetical protein AQUCO_00200271v1 [Aquilegia coerulea]|uniref:60S ribosomal export protein NMD3 n=1 Tax=Aquilegia coerulea TaxID=218851 RepID=A0A2G5F2H4_AQUCA|nr:hypothetical protein AQUCO_00200271v1 [Aquilegia coerulea]
MEEKKAVIEDPAHGFVDKLAKETENLSVSDGLEIEFAGSVDKKKQPGKTDFPKDENGDQIGEDEEGEGVVQQQPRYAMEESSLMFGQVLPIRKHLKDLISEVRLSEVRLQLDNITESLQKHAIIVHCHKCDCYLNPPKTWTKARFGSKELLIICVRALKNLNKVQLVHAEFVEMEPHLNNIKVKLTVRKEATEKVTLEQACILKYVVQDDLCESCSS